MSDATARRWMAALFVLLAAAQVCLLSLTGNGLLYMGDTHSEADAIRAAEAYVHDGLGSHHGLPRMLYGHRFPRDGTVLDHVDEHGEVPLHFRASFPPADADPQEWPFTHYPPGSDLILGTEATLFGLDPLWRLRVAPIVFGLLAIVVFFQTLVRTFGAERGLLMAAACAVVPMFSTQMGGFFFQGYAMALLLLQISLLLRIFWSSVPPGWRCYLACFALGFLQGWLSFDLFFVVSLLAIPFWLWRRKAGATQPLRTVFWLTAVTGSAYALAHVLHFWEVAADLGGLQAALAEFRNTATDRAGLGAGMPYLEAVRHATYANIRQMFKPTLWQFGPFLLLACGAAGYLALQRRLVAPLALAAALLLCYLWTLAMPQHTMGNFHFTSRHFIVFYFFVCLSLVTALPEKPARP